MFDVFIGEILFCGGFLYGRMSINQYSDDDNYLEAVENKLVADFAIVLWQIDHKVRRQFS